ncbi:unnamed protein product [Prunus armeniaca]|uniref:Uncharacterized protein n=1 Tax=Prunus armeniaca TaxID=36596 RepID=A0A6J5VA06_PRUAR|nr:unnamed protein product [Prunus armeniaca]
MWWWRSGGQTRPQGVHMAPTTGGGGWVLGNRLPSELLGMRALHPPPRWM